MSFNLRSRRDARDIKSSLWHFDAQLCSTWMPHVRSRVRWGNRPTKSNSTFNASRRATWLTIKTFFFRQKRGEGLHFSAFSQFFSLCMAINYAPHTENIEHFSRWNWTHKKKIGRCWTFFSVHFAFLSMSLSYIIQSRGVKKRETSNAIFTLSNDLLRDRSSLGLHYNCILQAAKIIRTWKVYRARLLLCNFRGVLLHEFDIFFIHAIEKKTLTPSLTCVWDVQPRVVKRAHKCPPLMLSVATSNDSLILRLWLSL